MDNDKKTPRARGFAAIDPQYQREIASAGGRAAHIAGRAHQFTSEQARAAGEKGRAARAKTKVAPVQQESSETIEQPVSQDV